MERNRFTSLIHFSCRRAEIKRRQNGTEIISRAEIIRHTRSRCPIHPRVPDGSDVSKICQILSFSVSQTRDAIYHPCLTERPDLKFVTRRNSAAFVSPILLAQASWSSFAHLVCSLCRTTYFSGDAKSNRVIVGKKKFEKGQPDE